MSIHDIGRVRGDIPLEVLEQDEFGLGEMVAGLS